MSYSCVKKTKSGLQHTVCFGSCRSLYTVKQSNAFGALPAFSYKHGEPRRSQLRSNKTRTWKSKKAWIFSFSLVLFLLLLSISPFPLIFFLPLLPCVCILSQSCSVLLLRFLPRHLHPLPNGLFRVSLLKQHYFLNAEKLKVVL